MLTLHNFLKEYSRVRENTISSNSFYTKVQRQTDAAILMQLKYKSHCWSSDMSTAIYKWLIHCYASINMKNKKLV